MCIEYIRGERKKLISLQKSAKRPTGAQRS